ncbi:hypothetical protein GCM10010313_44850 [Streptomyces violarus]|uniref:LPXTG cell wall anchor domain-containing protein n=1 Tax=Streptomyces violarus TaxID=67380 RepID=A0A7W4ZRY3_9ACTN|nr:MULTISPECIES: hypothetical protein [Streptomyces]MBB3077376.1 hypothetical protein [Streptomyces violarus]WRU00997.1 hypothetical protein VJ737_26435 [Streptomyces sp. CGMCC 4.1772]GHD16494.1 hypothetical protein GCM10010313_44850 [Streptomyces violarus]
MGSLRVTLCTSVLVAAALTPAAFAAAPGDTAGVSVTPATPAPGSDVALRVTGCAARTAVAASAAFVADAPLTVTDGELIGESRVPSTLKAGTYTVKITCGGAERTGTFTVRESRESEGPPVSASASAVAAGAAGQPPAPVTGGRQPLPEGGGPSPRPKPESESGLEDEGPSSTSRRPGAHASPVAPVEAGGGGAAHLVAAEDRGAGPGTAQSVTGLVLAGVAAVAVALGSVRRKRGTD